LVRQVVVAKWRLWRAERLETSVRDEQARCGGADGPGTRRMLAALVQHRSLMERECEHVVQILEILRERHEAFATPSGTLEVEAANREPPCADSQPEPDTDPATGQRRHLRLVAVSDQPLPPPPIADLPPVGLHERRPRRLYGR
jgi:hypothetical protein